MEGGWKCFQGAEATMLSSHNGKIFTEVVMQCRVQTYFIPLEMICSVRQLSDLLRVSWEYYVQI